MSEINGEKHAFIEEIYMISFIHGELAEIQEGMIVVEASGVGYGIRVPATVIGSLPSIGEEVKIYT